MNFKPAFGYTAVTLVTTKTTESGLIIPDNAVTDRVKKATVIAATGKQLRSGEIIQPPYMENQVVFFLAGNGIPMKLEGIDFLLLREEEILGAVL